MGEKDQDGKHAAAGIDVDELDPTQFINETRIKGVQRILEDSVAPQEIHYLVRREDVVGQRLGEDGISDVVQPDQADTARVDIGVDLGNVDFLGKGVIDVTVLGLHPHEFFR